MKPEFRGNSGGTAEGYDTKNDTNTRKEMEGMPQVADFMVELVGLEPTTSSSPATVGTGGPPK
jgi:hypothetical protein